MFSKVLIANRGEIACRIAATCARMGVASVAVYSDADAGAAHVAACDQALRIGPAPAAQSYLDGARIVRAALDSGAEAVHPGYGFLSENAEFAQACADAGLAFIGPPPQAIAAMGRKSEAKRLMQEAGVPVVPGYHGEEQDDAWLAAQAARIGWPVLIKASAGGGGKGMRDVQAAPDFLGALAACRREARAAFGDDAMLIEKRVQRPRHIEVQILADRHGNVAALFERDCSLQRRHQKVIEEAPAPGLSPAQRQTLAEAAVAAARAVRYVGAGTVEFIAESDGAGGIRDFYFMEMNTRLQVEHPVTEMITGLDLVEWQLRVAAGQELPPLPEQPRGHAVEARLYAENPRADFLPSGGRVLSLALPAAAAFAVGTDGAGHPAALRIDSGVREGDEVGTFYDPMIAKLIAWGDNRDQALHRLGRALDAVRLAGPACNASFLARLIREPAFAAGTMDTGLIERRRDALSGSAPPAEAALAAATGALLHALQHGDGQDGPWARRDGWSNGVLPARRLRWMLDEAPAPEVRLGRNRTGAWELGIGTQAPRELRWACRGAEPQGPRELHLRVQWGAYEYDAHVVGTAALVPGSPGFDDMPRLDVFIDGERVVLRLQPQTMDAADVGAGAQPLLKAPMPGRVAALAVQAGQRVEFGQALVVLEAMKMEHTLQASDAGIVEAVLVQVGDQVDEGAVLLRMRHDQNPLSGNGDADGI